MDNRRITLEIELNKESAHKLMDIAMDEGAFLKGEYALSSGRKSDRGYFDGKMVTLSPKGAYHVGKAVFDELVAIDVDAVGGLVIGAALIVSALAAVSYQEGRPIHTFIVREESKRHGTQKEIEGHLRPGSRVAIVDDVITTGTSIFKAIRAVEAMGCKVVKIIALVDRHEGGSDELRRKGYEVTAFLAFKESGEVAVEEDSAVAGDAAGGAIRK